MIHNILHNALLATNNSDNKFDSNNPLTFTAQEPNSTITLTKTGDPVIDGLQYRTNINSDWSTYTIDTELTLTNVDDYVQFKNTKEQLSTSASNFVQFYMTGKIAASGNIQSLLNYSKFCTPYCYDSMFYGCSCLTTAPELPATTLANYCYSYMFYNCGNLTVAPELPATNLATGCYYWMFSYCSSLISATELPATNLADWCYTYMFYSCTSLTVAPSILPATTLTYRCYLYMFANCISLTVAPELPATNLATGCYEYMFYNCGSLTVVPELPATNLAEECYASMFRRCSGLTVAPKLPATTLTTSCYLYMFSDCTNLTVAPELPATTLTKYCYQDMFSGCWNLNYVKVGFTDWNSTESSTTLWLLTVSETGTFVCPTRLDRTKRGYDYIPNGWTIQTY